VLDRLIGDRSGLPFTLVLSLRSQLLQRPLPTLLAVVALAASAALAASVEMATRSVSEALDTSANALAGHAELEVTAAGLGVPERFIDELREHADVESASPVIQSTYRAVQDGRPGTSLRVLGMDLLYDREVRDYGVARNGFTVRDPTRLIAMPDSIVISERLADRLGLAQGDRLHLRSAQGDRTVTVRGLLVGELSQAFGGQLAIMDVFALQALEGRVGTVDRIDLAVRPGRDLDRVVERLQEEVGGQVTVRRSKLRDTYVVPALGAFGFGIWAIALIGVLLSLFLTYAVISIVVDRRIGEFALLRAAGLEGRTVSWLVLLDALTLSLLGSLLGLAAARGLASSLVAGFSRASEHLQNFDVPPAEMGMGSVVLGLLAGVPVALLAAAEPARRAATRHPLEVLQARHDVRPAGGRGRRARRLGLVALCGLLLVTPDVLPLGPEPRLAVAVVLGVLAASSLTVHALSRWLHAIEALLGRVVPRVGCLVAASFAERRVETGATVGIWAAITAGIFALFSGLNGLAVGLDDFFVGMVGDDAVLVFTEDPSAASRARRAPVDASIPRAIAGVPGVTAVHAARDMKLMFRGREVLLQEEGTRVLLEHGGLRTLSARPEASAEALLRGEVLVSGAFQRRFGVEVGDVIALPTRTGLRDFRVGGAARSFTGTNGSIHVDSAVYREHFGDDGIGVVVFWTDRPVAETIAEIDALFPEQPLFYRYGEGYRTQTQRVLGRFRALLMLPVLVIAVIGLIGLGNVLVGNLASRRREFALIRASGGTPENILATVVLGGMLLGLAGTVAGVLLGLAWTEIVAAGVSERLGWRVLQDADPWLVALLVVAGALAAALAAVLPATLFRRMELTAALAGR